jgi:hypothetical protein
MVVFADVAPAMRDARRARKSFLYTAAMGAWLACDLISRLLAEKLRKDR